MQVLKTILAITGFLYTGCSYHSPNNTSCMENPGEEGKLFVFVGEKIDVKEVPDEPGGMDSKFSARYKIMQTICGNYNKGVIDFIAYDHYGRPAFEKYDHVLLFLSQVDDTFYHQKYQYFNVYKTRDGRWASPYSVRDYSYLDTENTAIKPVKIDFKNEVSFSLKGATKREIKKLYPQPYYSIVNDKAIAVWGNYTPELFQLKKEGVLRARGLFGKPDSLPPLEPKILIGQKKVAITNADSIKLMATWHIFLDAIRTRSSNKIREMSLDNMKCAVCEGMPVSYFYNDTEPIDSFITNAYLYLPKSQLWEKMERNEFDINVYQYSGVDSETSQPIEEESRVVYMINLKTITQFEKSGDIEQQHQFHFVKINGEYKFYGMESFNFPVFDE